MPNKKIKIYFSIEDNFPPYRVDVVELFNIELKKRGLDAEWYMRRKNNGGCGKELFHDQLVHLPYWSEKKGLLPKLLNRLAFWLCDIRHLSKQLGRSVELIQVRDKYIASLVGIIISRIKGVPFIYWCSYPFPEHYVEVSKMSAGKKRLYTRLHGEIGKVLLYKVIMPLSAHVFVQSDQMKRDIERYGVNSKKMTPVPMGVPQRLLEWINKNPVNVVPNRVVYLGTMTSIRQLHILIKAFALVVKQHPAATLLMVGDGEHRYEREELEQLSASLGLKNSVTFTGFIPIEDAWTYAASGAICISPIAPSKVLDCGSPTKLYEYMALGRPVVCNKHPEQSKVIDETGAGLCVEWGAEQFAEAIGWMLSHPAEAEKMGEKGPQWIADNRTYPILADFVWDQYQEVLQVKE